MNYQWIAKNLTNKTFVVGDIVFNPYNSHDLLLNSSVEEIVKSSRIKNLIEAGYISIQRVYMFKGIDIIDSKNVEEVFTKCSFKEQPIKKLEYREWNCD